MNDNIEDNPDTDIPLLEDVVSIEEIESEYIDFENNDGNERASKIQDYDSELRNMRDEIANQLEGELQIAVSRAIDVAIDEAIDRIGQILHDELDNSLPYRIKNLISLSLEKEFGLRSKYPDDESNQD
jgi:hypothetical protein